MPEETNSTHTDSQNDSLNDLSNAASTETEVASETVTADAVNPTATGALTLEEKLAKAEADRDAYKEQLLRKAADFENFRRTRDREMQTAFRFADEPIVKKILPTLDDLERVLKNADKFLAANPDAKIYVDGVRLVHQKLLKTLEERGVKRIESLGKKFDVNFHEALTQMEKDGIEAETILDEFEAGYTLHDKVIRHAKVVVAKGAE
jgi:molecular chaperone GrpE